MKSDKGLSIHIKREFPAPVDKLYEAWISPEALKQWWSPLGKSLKEVTNEVREGGNIRYKFEDSEGPLVITGEYREVKEKERLVYTWNFNFTKDAFNDNLFELRVEFSQKGDKSLLEIKQENLKDEEAVVVHQKGWNRQLDYLHEYLSAENK